MENSQENQDYINQMEAWFNVFDMAIKSNQNDIKRTQESIKDLQGELKANEAYATKLELRYANAKADFEEWKQINGI